MTLRAYFDETATHDHSRVAGIGGFVGAEDAWLRLSPAWQAVLDEYTERGVSWFHMAEALSQEGQFARIDKPSLNYIITQLCRCLGAEPLTPFFSAVERDAWDEVVDDEAFLKRFPHPVDLCFENIVQKLWAWGRREAPGERILPTFAHTQEFSPRMAEISRLYGAHDWYSSVLGPLAFEQPQRVVALQAADLLAHQLYWDVDKRFEPFTLATAGPTNALYWATRGEFVHGNIFDRAGLRLTMDRFRDAGYPSGPTDLF